MTDPNAPTLAWKAPISRGATLTRPEPVRSCHLRSVFSDRDEGDLEAGEVALREPGERVPYADFRRTLYDSDAGGAS